MYELTIKCSDLSELQEAINKLGALPPESATISRFGDPKPAEAPAKQPRSRKGAAKPVVASNTGSASPVPDLAGANSSQGDGSVPPADTTPIGGVQANIPDGATSGAASAGEDVTYTDEDIKVAMEAAAKRVDLNTLRGLLLKHGASRRSELKAASYAAFMADLKEL